VCSKLALQLTEDWGDVHTRLCNLAGVGKQQSSTKLRTFEPTYERECNRKVAYVIERHHALRQEVDALRTEMGAIPYGWVDPIVQSIQSIYIDADHLDEQLFNYREYRRHIARAGISWKQLKHHAARLGYRQKRSRYYLELSEDNRTKAREVSAFSKEAQLLRWQYQTMVSVRIYLGTSPMMDMRASASVKRACCNIRECPETGGTYAGQRRD
jgi:hypothetical protein